MFYKVIASINLDFSEFLTLNLLSSGDVNLDLIRTMEEIFNEKNPDQKLKRSNEWTERVLCTHPIPLTDNDQTALQAFRRTIFYQASNTQPGLTFNHPQWLVDMNVTSHFDALDWNLNLLASKLTSLEKKLSLAVKKASFIDNRKVWNGNPTQEYYSKRAKELVDTFSPFSSSSDEVRAIVDEMNAFLSKISPSNPKSKACTLL